MILRGKTYDTIKALGKWILPLLLALLPIVQAFVDKGDFSAQAYATLIIAALTLIANYMQSASKKRYTLEQERAGVFTVDPSIEGTEGLSDDEVSAEGIGGTD